LTSPPPAPSLRPPGSGVALRFAKYQALGNDYLVVDETDGQAITAERVRWLCDRHFGVGADGVLVPGAGAEGADFALAIWNPDGSEAEKSGNGLRIFARWLFDRGEVAGAPFAVATRGGRVRCQVKGRGERISVEMGRAVFAGPEETLDLPDGPLRVNILSVGNPHCVVFLDEISPALARRLGPQLETHPRFPERTNVQLMKILDRSRIQLEIWERGAGYTLASGSSACAAAAAAVRSGACDGELTVAMPGGSLAVRVGPEFELVQEGPAEKVFEGEIPDSGALLRC
jgi:diaminopimelate epimerase